eukprot:COSAG02_NODE_3505_length_6637_cov_2.581217_3_plen_117_part_00
MILVHSHDHGAALQQASRSQESFLNYSAIPWSSELTGRREGDRRRRPPPLPSGAATPTADPTPADRDRRHCDVRPVVSLDRAATTAVALVTVYRLYSVLSDCSVRSGRGSGAWPST